MSHTFLYKYICECTMAHKNFSCNKFYETYKYIYNNVNNLYIINI